MEIEVMFNILINMIMDSHYGTMTRTKAIDFVNTIKKQGIPLIEEMAEEIENCYGRETELTQRARDFINNDLGE